MCAVAGLCLSSPKHLWPLTQQTVFWNEQNGDDSSSLVDTGSVCPLLTSDTNFGSRGSFYYDGAGRSVADFKVTQIMKRREGATKGSPLLKPGVARVRILFCMLRLVTGQAALVPVVTSKRVE